MTKLPATFLAFAVAASSVLGAGAAQAQDKTLTISWWGFNGEKLESILLAPFREKCGCEIVFETGNNADRLNKLAARNGEGVVLQGGCSQEAVAVVGVGKLSNGHKWGFLEEALKVPQSPAFRRCQFHPGP